jgi:predicted ATP-grasp superfamily ATP-dependent carboligase
VLWLGPTGLTVVRSLGRAGVQVTAVHHDANEPSSGTRYARLQILPPLEQDENAWLEFLLSEGRRLAPRKAALLPVSDAHWLFIARHRRVLREHFLFALPEGDDLEQWLEKPFQYAAAAKAGVPFPRTLVPRGLADVHSALSGLMFPCLLKPVLSHLWQREYRSKLTFVRTPEELIRHCEDALARGLGFMIQEYIPAEDNEIYGLHCCLNRDGEPLGYGVARKLRQQPPRFGNSCLTAIVHEPRVIELGLRLFRAMKFHGIGSIEFKRDPRDGEFKLMEVNVRATLLMSADVDAGVDIPLLGYRDVCGAPPPPRPVVPTRFDRRVGVFASDMQSAAFYRGLGRLSRSAWLWSWRHARDTHFAWDDLRPMKGYVHMLVDHWKRGKFRRGQAANPTADEWAALQWDGVRMERRAPRLHDSLPGRLSREAPGRTDDGRSVQVESSAPGLRDQSAREHVPDVAPVTIVGSGLTAGRPPAVGEQPQVVR